MQLYEVNILLGINSGHTLSLGRSLNKRKGRIIKRLPTNQALSTSYNAKFELLHSGLYTVSFVLFYECQFYMHINTAQFTVYKLKQYQRYDPAGHDPHNTDLAVRVLECGDISLLCTVVGRGYLSLTVHVREFKKEAC